MKQRDKAILADLTRFRVMSRDQLVAIYFGKLKQAVNNCNAVMLRLYREGLVKRATDRGQFLYFPADSTIKSDSAKLPHFLRLVDVYIDLLRHEKPRLFNIELKYDKGLAEPDIFAIFKGTPMFIEVQRSVYSEKVMQEKIMRYEALYQSRIIDREPWQPSQKKVFPSVLILTDTRYAVGSSNFAVVQAASIDDFIRSIESKKTPPVVNKGSVKISIG